MDGLADLLTAVGEILFGGDDGGAGALGGGPGTAGIADAGYLDAGGGTPHRVVLDGNGGLRDQYTGNSVSPTDSRYHPK